MINKDFLTTKLVQHVIIYRPENILHYLQIQMNDFVFMDVSDSQEKLSQIITDFFFSHHGVFVHYSVEMLTTGYTENTRNKI